MQTDFGTLYLVPTPIGNLGDITLRALDVLKTVDLVAAEDTRKTGLLLKHFGIEKRQIAFHEHNEAAAGEKIIAELQSGRSVAVVTNAGSPGVSDPGFSLVRRAAAAEIPVTALPGAAALIPALTLSALPVHSFTFRGFPPRTSAKRQKFFAVDKESQHTLLFYESPYRIQAFLTDALAVFSDREGAVISELTKIHERVRRGKLSELIDQVQNQTLKGEFVIVIQGKTG